METEEVNSNALTCSSYEQSRVRAIKPNMDVTAFRDIGAAPEGW